MKIILTEDVAGLGDIGEIVTVRPGYARNFLIPRGFAIECETQSARQTKHHMLQIEAKKRRLKDAAMASAERIRELSIPFELRVSSSGRVFGSVTAKDISDRLAAEGFALDRRRVQMTEALRKLGTHFVKVRLHQEVDVQLKVIINQRAATQEEEEAEVDSARNAIETASAEKEAAADEATEE